MDSKKRICGPCKDDNKVACVYCSVCESALCTECKKEHGLVKLLKKHRLRDISELPSIETSEILKSLIVCPKHETEEVVYICKDHDVTCCSKCVIAEHRKCDEILVLTDIQPNLKETGIRFKHNLQTLNMKAQLLLKHETKSKSILDETENEAMALLKQIQNELLKAFENLSKEVLSSIAVKKKRYQTYIAMQTASIQQFQGEIKRHTSVVDQVEKFGSNMHINLMQRNLQRETLVHLQKVARVLKHNRSKGSFKCIYSSKFNNIILELSNALHIEDAEYEEMETSSDSDTLKPSSDSDEGHLYEEVD